MTRACRRRDADLANGITRWGNADLARGITGLLMAVAGFPGRLPHGSFDEGCVCQLDTCTEDC